MPTQTPEQLLREIERLEESRAGLVMSNPGIDPNDPGLVSLNLELADLRSQLTPEKPLRGDFGVPLGPPSILPLPEFISPPSKIRITSEPVAFSGCDIVPVVNVNGKVLVLGNMQALSYSIHRDKAPVRLLGHTYPRGYTRGSRTIAGTLVWTIFDQAALRDLTDLYGFEMASDDPMSALVPDQLPPFDITVTYWSEVPGLAGTFEGSYLQLFGVEIVDEGQSQGINDVYVENTMQYVARYITHMIPVSDSLKSAPGGLQIVTPFQRALFQANVTPDPSALSQSTQLEELQTRRAALFDRLGDVGDALALLDQYAVADEEGRDRDQLFAEFDDLQAQIRSIDRQLQQTRTRAVTDPYPHFGDNPFDNPTPRRL